MAKPQEKITVLVDRFGNIKFEATGYVGKGCVAPIAELERAFQAGSRKDDKKPEFYQKGGTAVAGEQRM